MTPHLTDTHLELRFTPFERVTGLLRDVRVPLSAIDRIEVVDDGIRAVRGLRAPGLSVPRVRHLGTWRTRDGKTLVAVRRGQGAVRITLSGGRWSGLLLGVDDPEELATALGAATPMGER